MYWGIELYGMAGSCLYRRQATALWDNWRSEEVEVNSVPNLCRRRLSRH